MVGGCAGVQRGDDCGLQNTGVAEDARPVSVNRAESRRVRVRGLWRDRRNHHRRSRRWRGHWRRVGTAAWWTTLWRFLTGRPPPRGKQDAGVADGAQTQDGLMEDKRHAVFVEHAGVDGTEKLSDDDAAKFPHQSTKLPLDVVAGEVLLRPRFERAREIEEGGVMSTTTIRWLRPSACPLIICAGFQYPWYGTASPVFPR